MLGDVIWFEPGEKHWNGVTPTTVVTHIAIAEKHVGKSTDWKSAEKSSEQKREIQDV